MKIQHLLIIVMLVSVPLVSLPNLSGHFGLPVFRKTIIEHLTAPVQVHEVRTAGLVTTNGRVIPLRFVKNMSATDATFAAATSRGIEIGSSGQVIGLVEVYHWCGNDPVGEHFARLDLSALAIYLGAEPTSDAPDFLHYLDQRGPLRRDKIGPGDYVYVRAISRIMDGVSNSNKSIETNESTPVGGIEGIPGI